MAIDSDFLKALKRKKSSFFEKYDLADKEDKDIQKAEEALEKEEAKFDKDISKLEEREGIDIRGYLDDRLDLDSLEEQEIQKTVRDIINRKRGMQARKNELGERKEKLGSWIKELDQLTQELKDKESEINKKAKEIDDYRKEIKRDEQAIIKDEKSMLKPSKKIVIRPSLNVGKRPLFILALFIILALFTFSSLSLNLFYFNQNAMLKDEVDILKASNEEQINGYKRDLGDLSVELGITKEESGSAISEATQSSKKAQSMTKAYTLEKEKVDKQTLELAFVKGEIDRYKVFYEKCLIENNKSSSELQAAIAELGNLNRSKLRQDNKIKNIKAESKALDYDLDVLKLEITNLNTLQKDIEERADEIQSTTTDPAARNLARVIENECDEFRDVIRNMGDRILASENINERIMTM